MYFKKLLLIRVSNISLDHIITSGVIFIFVFAPLAFGSSHVWAYTLLQLTVFSLWMVIISNRLIINKSQQVQYISTPMSTIIILIIVFGLFQIIPIPLIIIKNLSKLTYIDKEAVLTILNNDNINKEMLSGYISLSYNKNATIKDLLKVTTYAGIFYLILYTTKSKNRINLLVTIILLTGLFEALYSIYQVFNVERSVLWWKVRPGSKRWGSGTFIGSNQFAGYMEMILCIGIGYIISLHSQIKRNKIKSKKYRMTLKSLFLISSLKASNIKIILIVYFIIVSGIALLLSASRGGIISAALSLLLMSLLFITKRSYRKQSIISIIICIVILLYGYNIGIDATIKKFNSIDIQFVNRMEETRSGIEMMKDYPYTGVGLGSLPDLYPKYAPSGHAHWLRGGYLHNDWIAFGAEMGVAIMFVVLFGYIYLLYQMLKIWEKRHNGFAVGIGAGTIIGMISIAIHCYFELNMRIPANPVTFAGIAAIGWVVLHRRRKRRHETFFYKIRIFKLTIISRIFAIVAAALLFYGLSSLTLHHYFAEAHSATEWNSTMNLNYDPELPDIDAAIELNPINGEYHFRRAAWYMERPVNNEKRRRELNETIIRSLEKAVRSNPARARYWFALGWRYSYKTYDMDYYLRKWLPLADVCFKQAIRHDPRDADRIYSIAWYWVWRSTLLPRTTSSIVGEESEVTTQIDGITKFQKLFRQSFELGLEQGRDLLSAKAIRRLKRQKKPVETHLEKDIYRAISRVMAYYKDEDVILGILPEGREDLKEKAIRRLRGLSQI